MTARSMKARKRASSLSSDALEALEPAEEALHLVAAVVEHAAVRPPLRVVAQRWHDRRISQRPRTSRRDPSPGPRPVHRAEAVQQRAARGRVGSVAAAEAWRPPPPGTSLLAHVEQRVQGVAVRSGESAPRPGAHGRDPLALGIGRFHGTPRPHNLHRPPPATTPPSSEQALGLRCVDTANLTRLRLRRAWGAERLASTGTPPQAHQRRFRRS